MTHVTRYGRAEARPSRVVALCARVGAIALAAMAGCVSVKGEKTLVPPSGLFSHFRAPLAANVAPVPCTNLKVGKGDISVYVKDWVYSGIGADVCNMALQNAIQNGGLKKVYFADYEQTSYLGFVTLFTVTAYGE